MDEGKDLLKPKIKTLRIIALSMFFFVYVIMGGAIFQAIEGPVEQKENKELLDIRTKFMKDVSGCITGRHESKQ